MINEDLATRSTLCLSQAAARRSYQALQSSMKYFNKLEHILLICKGQLWMCNTVKTMAILHAEPSPALVDDKTQFRVEGLVPKQNVTIAAVLKESSMTFICHAHYMADNEGNVDINQHISLGGSFTGIEPMGLLWAMKAEKGSKPGIRLHKKDPTVPFDITIGVLDGRHDIQAEAEIDNYAVLCEISHPRTYMGPGVRRIPITEGRLRGALYLPPGNGPHPGVLDLFGTAGGLTEFRSALLASRGFASFALAYFAYDDLPKFLTLDLEYFEEAVDFLTTHPAVDPRGIATIGVSKGADLISYMAIYSPLVKAVVSIGPYHYYGMADHHKNGKQQPTAWPDMSQSVVEPEGLVIDEACWNVEIPEGALIELEKAKGAEFLFINGEDDRAASIKHTDLLINRLEKCDKNNYRLLRYPRAGHLIEPPYTPHCRSAYHKVLGQDMLFGGDMQHHAVAQEHSWKEILAFFKDRLNVEDSPTSKL